MREAVALFLRMLASTRLIPRVGWEVSGLGSSDGRAISDRGRLRQRERARSYVSSRETTEVCSQVSRAKHQHRS